SVYSLELNVPVKIGPLEVIPRRALDSEVDSMFQVKAGELNVLNVVDSWIDPATLSELAQDSWDMVLWPFQTMREIDVLAPSRAPAVSLELPQEWIAQLKILNPRCVVPSSCQFIQESWSWYNNALFPISYRQFEKEVAAALPQSRILRLNPSVAVVLDKNSLESSSSLPWVCPVGDQDVDYRYREDLKPPSTAEISRHLSQHFAPLDEKQREKVFDYCRSGLIKKYHSLEAPLDPYFEKPRIWQLSIYDHRGEATRFYYHLHGGKMEPAEFHAEPLSWTTEVPISKFYAALELGEALTSMYMRINDMVFEPEIEKEIHSADIVEDPLIRCLFNGVFGAYQLAQLKRLKARN
ncbi:MAG: MBL fold metallo-hydrolase, partial [Pseudobdellovibrionaceae bacterium]